MNLLIIICGQIRSLNEDICKSIDDLINNFKTAGIFEFKIIWSIDKYSAHIEYLQQYNKKIIYTENGQFHKIAYALMEVCEAEFTWIMKIRPDAILESIID